MQAAARVVKIASELLATGEPISFYDAMGAVRAARQADELGERGIAAMLALHDAGATTDGARDVLAEYLQGYARQVAREQELAARAITLKDSGEVARVRLGGSLLLALDEQAGKGFRWEAEALQGRARVTRRRRSPDAPATAFLDIELVRAGRVSLALVERPPPTAAAQMPEARLRRFTLEIVVESEPG